MFVDQPMPPKIETVHCVAKKESKEELSWALHIARSYPEIQWLADTDVEITEESSARDTRSLSKAIYGRQFVEFDRTLLSIKCIEWILDGSYEAYQAFTVGQTSKLSWEHFRKLHNRARTLLERAPDSMTSRQIHDLIIVASILKDMGKSKKARMLFADYGAKAPDHNDFYAEIIAVLKDYPLLCPSFAKLSFSQKEILLREAGLAHYGHITHLEGRDEMFAPLLQSEIVKEKDFYTFDFSFFVHICDVAGALGHRIATSSIVYDDKVYFVMEVTRESCLLLFEEGKNGDDALFYCVNKRAERLGLNLKNSHERVLSRVGAMIRLYYPKEGQVLKQAWKTLPEKEKSLIARCFDPSSRSIARRTPTYMPAVLVNLLGNQQLGKTKEERLSQTVVLGLPLLARVLENNEQDIASGSKEIEHPLDFKKVAGNEQGKVFLLFPIDIQNQPNGYSNIFDFH